MLLLWLLLMLAMKWWTAVVIVVFQIFGQVLLLLVMLRGWWSLLIGRSKRRTHQRRGCSWMLIGSWMRYAFMGEWVTRGVRGRSFWRMLRMKPGM